VNLYGASKLCAEKLIVQSNSYAGKSPTHFSCVRYGNVVGSRGSVVPIFIKQRHNGKITITDERMTRFWISLDQGVRFVIRCLDQMHGGEVFVPKIPSMKVVDLATAVAPGTEISVVGIRPGEKLHEVLISEDEVRVTVEMPDMYVVLPALSYWSQTLSEEWEHQGSLLQDGFRYTSNTNSDWLSIEQIREIVAPIELDYGEGHPE
jgi:UDP-N-acetylglucosamine 4,6-dehydratase